MSAPPVIGGDGSLAVAAELAADFRKGAAERDAVRRLPYAELERLFASGLLAVTVPAEFGGADVRTETLAEMFRLCGIWARLASAEASTPRGPPNLWAGIGLVRGGADTALVGSHDEVAERIKEYHALGIEEFIFSGYPHLEEAYWFGEGVLPRLQTQGLWQHPFGKRAAPSAQIPFAGAATPP